MGAKLNIASDLKTQKLHGLFMIMSSLVGQISEKGSRVCEWPVASSYPSAKALVITGGTRASYVDLNQLQIFFRSYSEDLLVTSALI
jgi:hypothetical protein